MFDFHQFFAQYRLLMNWRLFRIAYWWKSTALGQYAVRGIWKGTIGCAAWELIQDLFIITTRITTYRNRLTKKSRCSRGFPRIGELVETLRGSNVSRFECEARRHHCIICLLFFQQLNYLSSRCNWRSWPLFHFLELVLHCLTHGTKSIHILSVVHLESHSFLRSLSTASQIHRCLSASARLRTNAIVSSVTHTC